VLRYAGEGEDVLGATRRGPDLALRCACAGGLRATAKGRRERPGDEIGGVGGWMRWEEIMIGIRLRED